MTRQDLVDAVTAELIAKMDKHYDDFQTYEVLDIALPDFVDEVKAAIAITMVERNKQ